MRHSRVSKDELISDVLEWAPAYGETIVGRLERTYILQVCADTGFIWEEQPGAMDDWDGFRERQRLRERERERGKSVIYIYIYTHIFSSTNFFVGSQLFSVISHTRCFQLRPKPGWFYIIRISYSKDIVPLCMSKGIFYVYIYLHIRFSAIGVLNSSEELCIYA